MRLETKTVFTILLFIAMLGWGLSWVNVKVLTEYINEYQLAVFRFGLTALALFPVLIFTKQSFRLNIKDTLLLIVIAFLYIIYTKYFYLGTKLGTASLGGAFVTTLIPINTFLILALIRVRKVTGKDIFALVLGAFGVMTILNVWSFKVEEILIPQNLYFFIASIIWALITIISAKRSKLNSLVFVFYIYLFTTIMTVVFFLDNNGLTVNGADWIFWINIFAVSIFATTFSNTVYFFAIEKLGASSASSFVFLVPFYAILTSYIFLEEDIGFSIIFGTILTIIAVMILNNINPLRKRA